MALKKVSSQSERASMVQGPRETGKRQGRCSLKKQSGRGGTLPRHLGKGVGQRRWRGRGVRSAWVRVGSMKNSEPPLLSCLPRCDGLHSQEQINPSPSGGFCQHFVTVTRQVTKATCGLVLQTHRLQDNHSVHRVYLQCQLKTIMVHKLMLHMLHILRVSLFFFLPPREFHPWN